MTNWLVFVICFVIFNIGVVVGYFVRAWALDRRNYDGVINVIYDEIERKTLYSLEVAGDPADIQTRNEVIFKVETP